MIDQTDTQSAPTSKDPVTTPVTDTTTPVTETAAPVSTDKPNSPPPAETTDTAPETTSEDTSEPVSTEPAKDMSATAPSTETTSPVTPVVDITAPAPVEPVVTAPVLETPPVQDPKPISDATSIVKDAVNFIKDELLVATEEVKGLVNHNSQAVQKSLDDYLTIMMPGKPVDPQVGGREQYRLYKTIVNVISNQANFKESWNISLKSFNDNKDGAFKDSHIFRFPDTMLGNPNDHKLFQVLINLIKLTADPVTRKEGLTKVTLARTLDAGMTEVARSNLASFYS
jgi:hypothetical protein